MKIPRNVSGEELARHLAQFGFVVTRQTGSHMRLTSSSKGSEHHSTIPRHTPLKIGTLNSILKGVSSYLEIDRDRLIDKIFT